MFPINFYYYHWSAKIGCVISKVDSFQLSLGHDSCEKKFILSEPNGLGSNLKHLKQKQDSYCEQMEKSGIIKH